jgi:hypothetical protein
LNEAASKIQEWNKAGTLATIPKLLRWVKEEKGLEVTKRWLLYYIQKMGFKWGKTKRKGLLWENERIVKWKRDYLSKRVCGKAKGTQQPSIFLDKTYMHKNHAPNFSWNLAAEGNSVGTPVGKGQQLVLLHAGGEGGWIEGVMKMWVVKKNATSKDYHNNVNHKIFFEWFNWVCSIATTPSTFVMDNTGYHKVHEVLSREKELFVGCTFSKL